MNWARGLKFAGIHVAVAIPLIASVEIPRWETQKTHSRLHKSSLELVVYQEEGGTVEFTPMCEEWRSLSGAEKVFSVSETPALILSGWNSDCPARWTISGILGIDMKHRSLRQRLGSDIGLSGLIAIQWVLLGGLPLVKPRRWWLEPGAANTVLTCALAPVLLIFEFASSRLTYGEGAALVFGLTALFAMLLIFSTWIAWIGLTAQRVITFGWNAVTAASRRTRTR